MNLTTHMTDAERARLRLRLGEIEIRLSQAGEYAVHMTALRDEADGIRRHLESSEPKTRKRSS